jgi:hypothetical protein
MEFEWDERKARQNAAKHVVPFEYAARVFLDPARRDAADTRRITASSGGSFPAISKGDFSQSPTPFAAGSFG